MNCHRCGNTMIFKKFCDYGGYFYGWKCRLCGEIIDEIPQNRKWLKGDWTENKTIRNHYPITWRLE